MSAARFAWLAALFTAAAASASAQTTVNGSAELSVVRSETESASQSDSNGAVGQNYSLGWDSSLMDPRLFRYSVLGTWRSSNYSAATSGAKMQDGRAGDLGYRIGGTVLPASPMPFFFQTSRTRSTSAGDLAPTNPIRSGLLAASGAPPVDYESSNRETTMNWNLGVERLPQVSLSYRRGESTISGGQYQASQRDRDFSTSVLKNTRATHQTLRFQRTASENVMQQTYGQNLGLLDYDFGATLPAHLRFTLNAGRRNTFSRSVFLSPVDLEGGAYTPITTSGTAGSQYGQVNLAYEPNARVSLRATGSADRQRGDNASTGALLGSVSAHAEVVKGLSVTSSATTGQRQQVVAGETTRVATKTADAGITYQVNARHVGAGASTSRGVGNSVTPEGRTGQSESRAHEVHLSTTAGWFSASAGYDQSRYRDELLDFGNFEAERVRGSVQVQNTRASVSANADEVNMTRGRAATFMRNLQRTLSSTATLRLIGQSFVSTTAGHFYNNFDGAAGRGVDRTLFWSVGLDSSVRQHLRLSGWLRNEQASASRTLFDQDALSAFGRVEYRLRTLNFALEYRKSHSRMQYPGMLGPDVFGGRQIRFSVIRQFGARVR